MLVVRCGPNPDPSTKHEAQMAIVKEADVVCCTCVGAGSGFLNPKKKKSGKGGGAHRAPKFAGVLIDEAGQATEIAATVAVGLGCQQLVLVGDHHQLPPTVVSEQAEAEGLTMSLFERLVEAGVAPCVLDTQYRMHPAIAQFPSDCFYGGRIRDGISGADRPAPAGLQWPRPDFPVMFISSDRGSEVSDGSSKYNDEEVSIVCDVVQQLLGAGLPREQIGVVTPYGSQVRRLRGRLGHRNGLECQSVDGFQGREKTVIIISAVRANRNGNVGFLADWCRTNVAVTRARNGLVVIGNEATLRHDRRSWAPFFDWAHANGIVAGRPAAGSYDQAATRALADGRKEFTDGQKQRLASAHGLAPLKPVYTQAPAPTDGDAGGVPGAGELSVEDRYDDYGRLKKKYRKGNGGLANAADILFPLDALRGGGMTRQTKSADEPAGSDAFGDALKALSAEAAGQRAEAARWFYLDAQGVEQGPFAADQLRGCGYGGGAYCRSAPSFAIPV
jgi:regulator of nonsense transcripts 1